MLGKQNINIEKIGITTCRLKNIDYFSQTVISNEIILKYKLPDIEQILSIIIEPEIVSMRIINTIKGESCEGQVLSGKKVLVQVKLKQKIIYICNLEEHTVHVMENVVYQDISITVPKKIEGTDLEMLIKYKLLKCRIFVEEIVLKCVKGRVITQDIYILCVLEYIPTYELGMVWYDKCGSSNIYTMYNDGSNKKKRTFYNKCKLNKISWCPSGRKIAFICDFERKNMLYILDVITSKIKKVTNSLIFESIKSFSWSSDSNNIIFSANFKDSQQIFSLDVNSLEYLQLTYDEGESKYYKPKCDSKKSLVAFLKLTSGIINLYISDVKGKNIKKISYLGYIKDFDWSPDSKKISCIIKNKYKKDSIVVIDTETFQVSELELDTFIHSIKSIQYSTCGKYISFINKKDLTDDIYVYDILKKVLINVTKKDNFTKISSFVWQIDGNEIFYVSNDLGYFNIYSVSLKTLTSKQITNNANTKIELSYRPKIM